MNEISTNTISLISNYCHALLFFSTFGNFKTMLSGCKVMLQLPAECLISALHVSLLPFFIKHNSLMFWTC